MAEELFDKGIGYPVGAGGHVTQHSLNSIPQTGAIHKKLMETLKTLCYISVQKCIIKEKYEVADLAEQGAWNVSLFAYNKEGALRV